MESHHWRVLTDVHRTRERTGEEEGEEEGGERRGERRGKRGEREREDIHIIISVCLAVPSK